jgi:cyclic di-GMP phosphodiesterase
MADKLNITIDKLIEIVQSGGAVKTGVDVFNDDGILLLEKSVLIKTIKPLVVIKKSGISQVPINPKSAGGLWDKNGNKISTGTGNVPAKQVSSKVAPPELKEKLDHITHIKKEATQKFNKAKDNIKQVIDDIKKTGGEFDYAPMQETVTDLFNFVTRNDSAFFYLTKDIFSYDDYLYHHSINVCTIGTVIMKKFNERYGASIKKYTQKQLFDTSLGFFMHDVGKVLIPDAILNKPAKLTAEEFEIVKAHSFEKGHIVLEKNRISSPIIKDIVKLHHGAVFKGEERCYPHLENPEETPPHVKISKLADIYDAMTSKRCYKDAFSPVGVVTTIVRDYARKEETLQYVLHAFVKSVGIYPPGSVVHLHNQQMAYVLDSEGPIIIPFTDQNKQPLPKKADPMNIAELSSEEESWKINDQMALLSPTDAYSLLPDYLKEPLAA